MAGMVVGSRGSLAGASLMMAALSFVACGDDDGAPGAGGSGGAGTTSSSATGATSSTTTGATSSGDTSTATSGSSTAVSTGGSVCTPGAQEACYSGPPGTEGVGTCVAGIATCNDRGTAFGPCVGEVLPGAEPCGSSADEDCDGVILPCASAQ